MVSTQLIDRYIDLATREGNRKALAFRLNQMQPGKYEQQISALKLPTLIMWGGLDKLIPPESADLYHQQITGSQLIRFPQLGHVPQEEDPQSTVTALKEFLVHAPY